MYLLYLDESGNEDDPRDRHFVLGGAAIFERTTYFLSRDMDTVQSDHFPGRAPVVFHASAIRSGKVFWRGVEKETREIVLKDIAVTIAAANDPGLVLFAAVVEKNDEVFGEEAVRRATEEVINRFNIFLKRRKDDHDDEQRGLLIFSKGRFDARAKLWVRSFRSVGTQWGNIKNLSDNPFFAPMQGY